MGFKWSKLIKNYWTTIFIPSYLRYNYYRFTDRSRNFIFQGKTYRYFNHSYNTTWNNERTIEIPIVCKFVSENKDNNILEIGNVLSHYFKMDHDVVDKYEKADGVINEDVVDFQSSESYKLIISISTLEHVGWDEYPRDPEKIFNALDNLKKSLVPGGKLVVTLPLGHNNKLDKHLETGKIKFTENHYLKRISRSNKWKELESGFYNAKYDFPYPGGNVVFIGVYEKPDEIIR
jgi:hypothetical protein